MELMWTEKYRPQKFEDVIGLPRQFNKRMIEHPTHLLLVGRQGCGKTTCARILAKAMGAEILEKNASDDRGINVIREQVKFFCQKKSLTRKVMFLDEADGLTNDAQQSLRRIMEVYSNTIFILTANYQRRIIDPLQSRCSVIEFPFPSRKEVSRKLKEICKNESVEYNKSDIREIIERTYPDIRQAINVLQSSVDSGVLNVKGIRLTDDFMTSIVDIIRKKEWAMLRELVETYTPDYDALYHFIFWKVFAKEGKWDVKMNALVEIADRMYKNQSVSNPTINFMACAFKLSDVI